MNDTPQQTPGRQSDAVSPAQERAQVLVVDDEPINLSVIEAVLAPQGYDLICVRNAEEARAAAAGKAPDLVLLDVMMPGETGVDLCRTWRADPTMDTTPIVLVTALGAVAHRAVGLSAGADDYIEKPLDVDELVRRTATWLAVGRGSDAERDETTPMDGAERLLAVARTLAPDGLAGELATAMARAAGIDLAPPSPSVKEQHV